MTSLIGPSSDYSARERAASTEMQERLATLRAHASDAGWTFEIGYTAALDHNLESITGMRPPEDWLDQARRLSQTRAGEPLPYLDGAGAPSDASFNWEDKGCVTPVRDQGSYGSCWAFGTHAAFEGAPGDVIVLDLEENVTTGYSWMLDDLPPSVLRVTEDQRMAAPGVRMGAPGRRRIRICAIGPGQAAIRAVLRRPWETDQAPAQTITAQVDVH